MCLVALALRADGFEHFRCDRPLTLGLHMANVAKILKCAGGSEREAEESKPWWGGGGGRGLPGAIHEACSAGKHAVAGTAAARKVLREGMMPCNAPGSQDTGSIADLKPPTHAFFNVNSPRYVVCVVCVVCASQPMMTSSRSRPMTSQTASPSCLRAPTRTASQVGVWEGGGEWTGMEG